MVTSFCGKVGNHYMLSLPEMFNLKRGRERKKIGLYKSSGVAHAALLNKNILQPNLNIKKKKD
jgi:hypothetical protein